MLGAVEGGGTKFLCAVGQGHDRVVERVRIETTTPERTLDSVVGFLRAHPVRAVGIATFGPLELADGPTLGRTLATPKPGWSDVPVRERLGEALGVPVAIDTDVNAAALAEQRWGAARDADPALYVTVGTGVGGGVAVHGRPLHGLLHPELGHLPVPRIEGDRFEGACPFHGRCLEGLVSGPAVAARAGMDARRLPDAHPALVLAARYLGVGLAAAVLVLSPRRILVGGGLGLRLDLDVVRSSLRDTLGGYLPRRELTDEGLGGFVRHPELAAPGLAGAFLLAEAARAGRRVAPTDPL